MLFPLLGLKNCVVREYNRKVGNFYCSLTALFLIAYCSECYHASCACSIHGYNYKPDPIFYGNDTRFFGVELEIDEGGKDARNAHKLLTVANTQDDHAYIKTDGSLDDGLEIVTPPMTLCYHTDSMPWQDILHECVSLGYQSHRTDTCGLHVHVNRSSLGSTEAQQEQTIANILYIFERFWQELLRFSRRTEYQVSRWAARYGYKNTGKEILDEAKKSHAGRYTCVNLTNYYTIEFRIFRGTLKLNTLIATLQLVNEICNVAFSLSEEEVHALSWTDFMLRLPAAQNPQLVQYLKERRLYVNEPVTEEGEA